MTLDEEVEIYLQCWGRAFRETRERLGMSQEDLCKKIRISRDTLSQFENGHRNVSVMVVINLSRALGMKAEEIGSLGDRYAEERIAAIRAKEKRA